MTQPPPPPPGAPRPRASEPVRSTPPAAPGALRGPSLLVLVLAVLGLVIDLLWAVAVVLQGIWQARVPLLEILSVGTVIVESALLLAVLVLASRGVLGDRRIQRLPLLPVVVIVAGSLLAAGTSLLPALGQLLKPPGPALDPYGAGLHLQPLAATGVEIVTHLLVVVIAAMLLKSSPSRGELRLPVGTVPVALLLAVVALLAGTLPIGRGFVLSTVGGDFGTYLVVDGVVTTVIRFVGVAEVLLLGLLVLLTSGLARTVAWVGVAVICLSRVVGVLLTQVLVSFLVIFMDVVHPPWVSALSGALTLLAGIAVAVCAVIALVLHVRDRGSAGVVSSTPGAASPASGAGDPAEPSR